MISGLVDLRAAQAARGRLPALLFLAHLSLGHGPTTARVVLAVHRSRGRSGSAPLVTLG